MPPGHLVVPGALSSPEPRHRKDGQIVDTTTRARTIRVFLLDDHDAFLRGITAVISAQTDLEVVGYAQTAQDALNALSNCHPDIAVLDIRLDGPDLSEQRRSGIDVCRDIRATYPEVACLMLTAFADDHALVEASLAGAAAFVLKQINGTNLLESIRQVADGAQLLDEGIVREAKLRLTG